MQGFGNVLKNKPLLLVTDTLRELNSAPTELPVELLLTGLPTLNADGPHATINFRYSIYDARNKTYYTSTTGPAEKRTKITGYNW